jgi:branched-chain amino acid transport system substrate-binding protein
VAINKQKAGPTRWRAKSLAVAAAAALVFAACGSGKSNSADSGDSGTATTAAAGSGLTLKDGCDEVKVGVVFSLSGAYSQLGNDGKTAIDAFAKTHPTILGKKLTFQIENDTSDPTASAAAYKRVLADKCVVATIGPNVGATMNAAFPVFQPAKIPVLVGTPNPYTNYNKEPYIFSPNLTPLQMQRDLFIKYFETLGLKKAVVLTGDDATGDVVQTVWSASKVDVTRVPLAVTNYEPTLAQLKSKGYDAVAFIGSGGEPPGHVARGLKALGWNAPLFLAPSNLTTTFMNLAGPAAEGARGFIWPAGAGPEKFKDNAKQLEPVQEIRGAVAADVDIALRPNVAYLWDNARSLYLAIEEAKSVDPAAIQKVLDTQEYYGANGLVKRSSTDHAGVQMASAIQAVVKNGKLVAAS